MLESISWPAYWEALVILTALYYLVIILGFYRKDMMELWNNKKKTNRRPESKDKASEDKNQDMLHPSR